MIKEAIVKLSKLQDLSSKETEIIFNEIFDSLATSSQIAAFLSLLKIKRETEDEISAAAVVVRARAAKVSVREGFLGIEDKNKPIMDTCGTGGSGLDKFNVSTAVAFVVSASGVMVAKHGNRAMSSNCGSADVLEFLGLNIEAPAVVMERAVREVGIGFLYAPLYHTALGKVAKIRREIGIRTIFNILGPLCNPALANYQLLGVYSKDLTRVLAKVLKILGLKSAFVVYGKDVADEISLTGTTYVSYLKGKKISEFSLSPASFGLKKINLKDLMVKDAKSSAKIIKDIFNAKLGPCRDMVLANSAACFYILGKVSNLKEGAKLAANLIDEGLAKAQFFKLNKFLKENA